MFAYLSLGASDIQRSATFYDATLGVLGISRCIEAEGHWEDWLGWGLYQDDGARELALWICAPFDGQPVTCGNGTMVALQARTWLEVQVFHASALAHGGVCEGPPGLRPQYGADFYAAYVRDPDGNKLAAVCRGFHPGTNATGAGNHFPGHCDAVTNRVGVTLVADH